MDKQPDASEAEERPTNQLTTNARAAGLPIAAVSMLPPIAALFGITGLPAFGIAALAALSSSLEANRKMREFGRIVDLEVGLLEAGVSSAVDEAKRAVEAEAGQREKLANEVNQKVGLLTARLDDLQTEQLAFLFQEFMSTLDERRLALLRTAVKNVAKNSGSPELRAQVLAGIRLLGPSHLNELRRFYHQRLLKKDEYKVTGPAARHARRLRASLVAAGFLEVRRQADLEKVSGMTGTGIANGARIRENSWETVTVTGLSALLMVFDDMWLPEEGDRFWRIYRQMKEYEEYARG